MCCCLLLSLIQNYFMTLQCPSMQKILPITSSFQTLRCVFQRLLSVILMVESSGGCRREALPITSAVTGARNQAVKFIRCPSELCSFLLACLCFAVEVIKG